MALQLRPNCEYCDKDLPPTPSDACLLLRCRVLHEYVDESKLHNLSSARNCDRGVERRPIRPASRAAFPGVCVTKQLPSDKQVHLKYAATRMSRRTSARLAGIPPEAR